MPFVADVSIVFRGRRIPMRRLFPAFSSVHGEEAGDLLFTEIRLMKGALDQREYDRCF